MTTGVNIVSSEAYVAAINECSCVGWCRSSSSLDVLIVRQNTSYCTLRRLTTGVDVSQCLIDASMKRRSVDRAGFTLHAEERIF